MKEMLQMSLLTKKMITETALKLAEKKSINKITVNELSGQCGISRNTFYYHFHDIYDVFLSFIDNRIDEMVANADKNAEDAMLDFIETCIRYKYMFQNLYKSLGHELTSKFAHEKLERLLLSALEKNYDTESICEDDLDIIFTFYEEAIIGVMIRWLRDQTPDDPTQRADQLNRIKILFCGQIDLMIHNSLNANETYQKNIDSDE